MWSPVVRWARARNAGDTSSFPSLNFLSQFITKCSQLSLKSISGLHPPSTLSPSQHPEPVPAPLAHPSTPEPVLSTPSLSQHPGPVPSSLSP